MDKPWSDVEESKDYQALAPEEKISAKEEYFSTVVAEKEEFKSLKPEEQSSARSEFLGLERTPASASTSSKIEDKSVKPTGNEVADDYIRGLTSGLMKGGANMLDTEQKVMDIVTRPFRTQLSIKKDATITEKILGQNIKETIAPITNTFFGDQAKQARVFAEDYFKAKSLGAKVVETVAQAPAFIAENAMMGGGKLVPALNKLSLPILGAIQGSQEGKIGVNSAKQAGINMAIGKVFGAIEKINPGPQTSMALKTIATASRATLGGVAGGVTSALSNGDLYANSPDKFDNFVVDFVASGLLTALPSAKPYDLAKKVVQVSEAKTKLFDEFVGTMKDDINADLNHSIGWGKERPVEAMFTEVMKGEKPVKTYKELVGKTESKIQEVQNEKARSVDESNAKIEIEPTLGIETLRRNELLSPGGSANKKAIQYYDAVIAREKGLVKDMNVLDAFKRTGQLKIELNDNAMRAQNRPPLTRTEKAVNESLIADYNRAIAEVLPSYKKLSAKESSLISLKELLNRKAVVQQTSPSAGFSVEEAARSAQLRGAGFKMSVMGTMLQAAKDIVLRGNSVERTTKDIMKLQKEIDAITKLQAKKIINQDKIEEATRRIGYQYTPVRETVFPKQLGTQKLIGSEPIMKGMEQPQIEGRILGKRKELPSPEKFERVSKETSEARLREQKMKRFDKNKVTYVGKKDSSMDQVIKRLVSGKLAK